MDGVRTRLQAARWVITLGRVEAGLLVLQASGALLAAVLTWSAAALVVAVLLAGLATGWTLLVRAFAAHRSWAWAVQVAVAGVVLCWDALVLAGGSGWRAALGAVLAAVTLGLLLHPDSREWCGVGRRGAGPAGLPHDHRRSHVSTTEEPA